MLAAEYHDRTKHHFHRFARSAGGLDWATQPNPFRRYAGAPLVALPRLGCATDVQYDALFGAVVPTQPLTDASVADLLRCSMGLSAWKSHRETRWALRVNPSSGNLHPTETYLVRDGRVFHYAPEVHALEERCALGETAWIEYSQSRPGVLVGFTSIPWREAWKYGERAFRYCQHDLGHALAALRFSAAMMGWRVSPLERWDAGQVAALLGIDRRPDDPEAEREEAECLVVVTPGDCDAWSSRPPEPLVAAAARAEWAGTANRLSPARVEWTVIDEVTLATRYPGSDDRDLSPAASTTGPVTFVPDVTTAPARTLILQRRSAVAFDAGTGLARPTFLRMLNRLQPPAPPWDVMPGPARVHLILFVHRVEGMTPGLYAYLRDGAVEQQWRAAMRPEFLWEVVGREDLVGRLFLLVPADVTWPAKRVSCDQDIAGDGFFSLGMLAPLASALDEGGQWMYRRLFWECGVIGQVLYLEAEAAGGRGTGIGCFYDDAVHEMLGLTGSAWQSLYHFSMGMPVDDERLTTEPGYAWEASAHADDL